MVYWIPLESNPEIFTRYAQALGTNESVSFCDIYGLDEDLLAVVPRPVFAISLLIPSTAAKTMKSKFSEKTILDTSKYPNNLWYTFQKVGNACGTVAMMHILANTQPNFLKEDSNFGTFVAQTKENSPAERAELMEKSDELAAVHDTFAGQGSTAPLQNADDKVDEHFVALVPLNGQLIELDGAKEGPVVHCESGITDENFLTEAAKVCRQYMDASEGSLKFAITALVKTDSMFWIILNYWSLF